MKGQLIMKNNKIIYFLKDFKIKKKILLLVLFFILITIIVGIFGYISLKKSNSIDHNLINKIDSKIIKSHNLKDKIEDIQMNTVLHILSTDSYEKNNLSDKINLLNKDAYALIEELKLNNGSKSLSNSKNNGADLLSKYYDILIIQWKEYNKNIDVIFQLINAGEKENAIDLYKESNELIFGKIIESFSLIFNEYDKEIALLNLNSDKTIKFSTINLFLIMLIGIFLSIILSLLISSNITTSINEVVKFGNDIASGIFPDKDFEIKCNDEIGIVADVFNKIMNTFKRKCNEVTKISEGDLSINIDIESDKDIFSNALFKMCSSLNNIITNINNSVIQVASSSVELADSSQNLSQGASVQASSLEQISSSIAELLNQVKHNADNAVEASDLSKKSMKNAQNGNDQMIVLIKAMSNINRSADEIKKIIKVIDEIAFQTNILSLNANVEAARAGKYGKGFAVVAEEVRNLSSRSTKSVLETTAIVEQTIKNIQDAYQIVETTSIQLEDIVKSTLKVANLVEEIAIASQEQTRGLDEINQGLTQIEQVTESNTANAEESASTSEELASQAQQLKTAVEKFKIVKRDEKESIKNETKFLNSTNGIKKETAVTQNKNSDKNKYLDKLNKIKMIKNKPKLQVQIEHFVRDDIKNVDIKAQKILVNPKKIIKLDDADFGKF